jgi:CBS domain-containing protein
MTTATKKRRAVRAAVAAKDIMETRIVTVSPSAPLSEVERLLTEHRISGMPVTDARGRAIGVVSYRDLLDHYAENPDARPRRERAFYRLSTEGMDDEDVESFDVPPESEDTVEDVMTPEVIRVGPEATLREVAHTMASHGIHRVLVVERASERVVGIISSMGVLAAVGT